MVPKGMINNFYRCSANVFVFHKGSTVDKKVEKDYFNRTKITGFFLPGLVLED
jgi:hypothetical protein